MAKKLKTCKCLCDGITYEGVMKIDTAGMFSIQRPGTQQDWPHKLMTITGNIADELERSWRDAVKDLHTRSKSTRKVIMVVYDSALRVGGSRDFFTRDSMLTLRCSVALETITTTADGVQKAFKEHPDFCGLHSKPQPFPSRMQLEHHEYQHTPSRESITVVEWSQETEGMLVRACEGILAVVNLLDKITESPEALMLAATSGVFLLGNNNG